jgi:TATA-box binding protein (TBP) (component of TFIID and TFIIIB)
MVALFIGAANRDVTTFQEPLEIKLDRTEKHLAFSRGKISCIGQFASFRISLNFIKCMLKLKGTFTILDDEPPFEVGGVVKIADIKTIYHVG